MKRLVTLTCMLLSLGGLCLGQLSNDHQAIKLFIDQATIASNNKTLSANNQKRLFTKLTQLINQTGLAEVGYSNFLVTPVFDVLSVSQDDAGIGKVWLAECEFSLTVSRREYNNLGAASFSSFSKKIMGSGSGKEEAINNAINNISANDQAIVGFFKESKKNIDDYFKVNCDQVAKEANHAFELNEYNRSIALYFSIPSSAPCYEEARTASVGVYMKYIEDACEKQLIRLRAVVAMGLNPDSASSAKHYNEALYIMSNLDPASPKCYAEARMQIEKIEKRFDEKQKQKWELEVKKAADKAALQKEMYKAMAAISTNYQPVSTSVIITR